MSSDDGPTPLAVIFGCAGPGLGEAERQFFADADPAGFILFERNCRAPDQLRGLVGELRACCGGRDAPVLIDQEGGRVARLKPPHWRAAPAAGSIGTLARRDLGLGREAAWTAARRIAADLFALGITVDCAPVVDVPAPGAHGVVGDRAFADSPDTVAELGRAFAEGLLAGGVLPVVKHIPGHGRATVDSHAELPVVRAPAAELEETDFAPFRALNDMPWAMTAHVVYAALDPDRPATTSPAVIERVVRGSIGFEGVLVSDDISMGALEGTHAARTAAALAAGCDLVLHCTGRLAEMEEVAAAARPVGEAARARLARAEDLRAPPGEADVAALEARLRSLIGETAAVEAG